MNKAQQRYLVGEFDAFLQKFDDRRRQACAENNMVLAEKMLELRERLRPLRDELALPSFASREQD